MVVTGDQHDFRKKSSKVVPLGAPLLRFKVARQIPNSSNTGPGSWFTARVASSDPSFNDVNETSDVILEEVLLGSLRSLRPAALITGWSPEKCLPQRKRA